MESPSQAADRLHEALFGKNKEETSLDIVLNNNLEQRLLIAKSYYQQFGNPLYEDIKSKLSGNFKELVGYLFLTPMEFNAKMLKRGFKGLSIDEQIIFEILAVHTPEEYQQIEEAYKIETKKELKKDIEKSFSGSLRKNILNLLTTPRRVNPNPDKSLCERWADDLINAGEKRWIEDENLFQEIFIQCSAEEMVMVARYYYQKTQVSLIETVEKKFSGKNKTLLKEIIYGNIIPHELYAEKMYQSIKGIGTNNSLLNRCLASRCRVDMLQIKDIYLWKYGRTLKEDIIGDTSGIYQKLCVYITEC
jgi:hypothetical protein